MAIATTTLPARARLANLLTWRFATNYLSTLAFMGLSYWFISSLSSFHKSMMSGAWHLGTFGSEAVISVDHVFVALFSLYTLILIPYYAAYPWMRAKSFTFALGLWFAVRRGRGSRSHSARTPGAMSLTQAFRISPLARQSGLALLLKFFFAPLMINWCLIHIANLAGSLMGLVHAVQGGTSGRLLFDNHVFWATFQLLLFIDTLLFTIGYIVELPALGNRIRSVEPTFFGWFICLICYPPFIDFTLRFVEWQSSDFPSFANDSLHLGVNVILLLAMTVFAWSSISLGFKASNLTNRGIVTHGPYRFVRHPAYAAKNLAWWLGALPMLGVLSVAGDWRALIYSLVALAGWTLIYVLRALTEERHLRLLDNGYAQYAHAVRWRFVPGIW